MAWLTLQSTGQPKRGAALALRLPVTFHYKGFPKIAHAGFPSSSFFVPDPIHHPLPLLREKVKDCGITTGHVEHLLGP